MSLEYDSKKSGLSFDPAYLHTGGNSGYQAINLAVLLGAKRILLLGYDMRFGSNGEKHWHADHAQRNPTEGMMVSWIKSYETLPADLDRAGVEVINCSPDSALTCFPTKSIGEAL